ncbi:LysM peptidoglycan-binding domain-containing protein [Winogradskyella sp. UBA3174]|uniref:LysM peptidoglycan-binding domain-containing protein n=1 Tax=Winogradskyella sp. UBA3174 TaxID=1947785 RepID=UPI0025F8CF1A|nr:LysM peptidoglycan-binding domain-containing protein [Winogradskyella sp. UBA3174]|tara:strand:+ start:20717 stop:21451 length:735 start_codon:yes stop_codon:yes gene_type:complete
MQKNYKLIISIAALVIASLGLGVFAQSEVAYKDVILDGKPARLNVATGEITLVNFKTENKVKVSEPIKPETIEDVSNYHIVKENETLLDISRIYNVSLTDLKKVNGLQTTLISEGQKLRVKNLDAKVAKLLTEESKPEEIIASNFHTVKKGETLYSLSKRYKLDLKRLKNLNDLDSNTIKIGQKLRVISFDTHKASVNASIWTVSKGDTLYSISKKSGVSVAHIKQLNSLTSTTILVGQKLQIK